MHRRFLSAFRTVAPGLLAITLAMPALATPRDEGETAFRAGDFAAAASLFEQAIAEGDASNSTRYNLAVSQFRQNEIAKANANFRLLVVQGFRTADVLYSLAVTEKLLGNTAAALGYFTTVAASSSALADEAIAQLQALDANAVVQNLVPNSPRLASSLLVATGYNDAIVEVQDGKLTRNGDWYAETNASVTWQSPFRNPWHLDLNFSLYNNTYADTPEQNFSIAGFGLQQSLAPFGQRVFWTLDVDASQLDKRGFQQGLNAGVGLEKQYLSSGWRLAYRFRASDSLNTAFDPFAGRHHRLQADYRRRIRSRHQLSLRVTHERIAREPLSNTQSTLDLSRDLASLDLTWAYQWTPTLQASAGLTYGAMRADDYQRFTNGTRLRRSDDNLGFLLALRKNIARNLGFQFSYNHNANDSTLGDFTYEQSLYEIGVVWTPAFP